MLISVFSEAAILEESNTAQMTQCQSYIDKGFSFEMLQGAGCTLVEYVTAACIDRHSKRAYSHTQHWFALSALS